MARPARVLLVEDDPADVFLFQEMLSEHLPPDTLRLIHVTTGEDALDWLEDHDCELVILDLDLPRTSGLEVLQAMKSNERQRRRPVVVWTTSDHPNDVRAVYERHGNAYVSKQSRLGELGRAVRDLTQFWFMTAALPT